MENLDVSAPALYEPIKVSDFILKYSVGDLSDSDLDKIEGALKGLKVEAAHGGYKRRYTVVGISKLPANLQMFTFQDKQVSVVNYFRIQYGITLENPQFPSILAARGTYLPAEVCTIVEGQSYTKLLNDAAGGESRVSPLVGPRDMIDKKIYVVDGGNVQFWTCVNFSTLDEGVVTKFLQHLSAACISNGVTFNSEPLLPNSSAHPGQIEKTLYDIHTQSAAKLSSTGKHLQMLIIILPDDSAGYHDKIKGICETELGIVSQCCRRRTITKKKGYLRDMALKINKKVGGRNSDCPTIIFGADATHPKPGDNIGYPISFNSASSVLFTSRL